MYPYSIRVRIGFLCPQIIFEIKLYLIYILWRYQTETIYILSSMSDQNDLSVASDKAIEVATYW